MAKKLVYRKNLPKPDARKLLLAITWRNRVTLDLMDTLVGT